MAETIVIASDHAGYDMKALLASELGTLGFDVLDLGAGNATEPVDYPDFAAKLAGAIEAGRARRGVLVCGSGIGISIAANRHRAIRAALCRTSTDARLARQHNDANVLAVGSTRVLGTEAAKDILRVFLATAFEAGRHVPRVEKLSRP